MLMNSQGRKWLVTLGTDPLAIPGLGVLNPERLRANLGSVLDLGGQSLYVLRPSARDLADTLERMRDVRRTRIVVMA